MYTHTHARTVGDELGDHGVVEHGDLRPLVHARVDAHRGEAVLFWLIGFCVRVCVRVVVWVVGGGGRGFRPDVICGLGWFEFGLWFEWWCLFFLLWLVVFWVRCWFG
jgi:hypothetical protein